MAEQGDELTLDEMFEWLEPAPEGFKVITLGTDEFPREGKGGDGAAGTALTAGR
ncbi:hypothetical protein [Streptomyces montanus]|uniref:hypothetical protein n=1 Tax=Streptomyces montanus TaxID=2580423 RepID=UPI0026B2990C